MSAEKKVELILSVKDEYGVAPVLRALDLPRSTWHYHENQKIPYEQKYAHIRPILEDVLRELTCPEKTGHIVKQGLEYSTLALLD